MGLVNMCPEKLRNYLLIKREIVDCLVDEARRGKLPGGRAAALGVEEAAEDVTTNAEELDWEDSNKDEYECTMEQLLAIVRQHNLKAKKGKGKAKRPPVDSANEDGDEEDNEHGSTPE